MPYQLFKKTQYLIARTVTFTCFSFIKGENLNNICEKRFQF